MRAGALGGGGGAQVAAGSLTAIVVLLLIVVGVFVYLYISQKHTMNNDCACLIGNTVHWPEGKGKDSPIWKGIFPGT